MSGLNYARASRRRGWRLRGKAKAARSGMSWLDQLRASSFGQAILDACDRQEDAPRSMLAEGWSGQITCGACPVQVEGTVDGFAFYFRARDGITFSVAAPGSTDAVMPNLDAGGYDFELPEETDDYGGWIAHSEAWRLVAEGVRRWREWRSLGSPSLLPGVVR